MLGSIVTFNIELFTPYLFISSRVKQEVIGQIAFILQMQWSNILFLPLSFVHFLSW